MSLLTVVKLRQDNAAAPAEDMAALTAAGQALVALRDWTFLLGPGLMPAVNALLFGTLLYRSSLVPRVIPVMGLVGAPLLLASGIATYFGHNDQLSPWSFAATLPIAAWELTIGTYMLTKGFPSTSAATRRAPAPAAN